jgi:small subunit ribosomal protein S8
MGMTDPVADLLTRIRNASRAKKHAVDCPASNLKRDVLRILKENHFIRDYMDLPDKKQGILRIYLRYSRGDRPVILGLERVSSPGLRKYVSAEDVRMSIHNTRGISVLSTSSGVMSNFEAAKQRVGGELLLRAW